MEMAMNKTVQCWLRCMGIFLGLRMGDYVVQVIDEMAVVL